MTRNVIFISLLLYSSLILGVSHREIAKNYDNPIKIAIADFTLNQKEYWDFDGAQILTSLYDSTYVVVSMHLFERFSTLDLIMMTEKDFGSKSKYLPTDWIEIDNRLFFWNDINKRFIDIIPKLKKYHRLEKCEKNYISNGGVSICYYFCVGDFSKYKVRIYKGDIADKYKCKCRNKPQPVNLSFPINYIETNKDVYKISPKERKDIKKEIKKDKQKIKRERSELKKKVLQGLL